MVIQVFGCNHLTQRGSDFYKRVSQILRQKESRKQRLPQITLYINPVTGPDFHSEVQTGHLYLVPIASLSQNGASGSRQQYDGQDPSTW